MFEVTGANYKWEEGQLQHSSVCTKHTRFQRGGWSQRLIHYQQASSLQGRESFGCQPPGRCSWSRTSLIHQLQKRQWRPCRRSHWRTTKWQAVRPSWAPSFTPCKRAYWKASVFPYSCFSFSCIEVIKRLDSFWFMLNKKKVFEIEVKKSLWKLNLCLDMNYIWKGWR